jgi:hypothetical protein
LLQQKGFLHSSQDCTRAVLQQSKIGLTIEQRQDNHYDGSYVTLAGEIILEPKKGGLHTTYYPEPQSTIHWYLVGCMLTLLIVFAIRYVIGLDPLSS